MADDIKALGLSELEMVLAGWSAGQIRIAGWVAETRWVVILEPVTG